MQHQSNLVLKAQTGQFLFINGARIQFRESTSIVLQNKARFVIGHQAMLAEWATTPLQVLYLILQDAYVGDQTTRVANLAAALALAQKIEAEANRSDLSPVVETVADGQEHCGLKALRTLIRNETERAEPVL